MNLDRSTEATALAKTNKSYLRRFRDLWKMGEGMGKFNSGSIL